MSNSHIVNALKIAAVTLLIFEFILRLTDFSYYWAIWRAPDINLGWRPLPNASAWQRMEGEALVETNSLGFRGPEPAGPGEAVFRVAMLGDSFTESIQLPFEKSWGPQLAKLLNAHCELDRKVSVQNFSVSGYSTAQQLRVLQHIVPAYEPDLVLLMFFTGNDVLENHPALAHDQQRPFFDAASNQWQNDFREGIAFRIATMPILEQLWRWTLRLRVTQAIIFIGDTTRLKIDMAMEDDSGREPGVDPAIYTTPTDPYWQAAWNNTEALLAEMQFISSEIGADFLVAMAPTGYQVMPDTRFRTEFLAQVGADDRSQRRGAGDGGIHPEGA